jgi:glycosyltransferase involved in cell wall biosynthesis
MVDAVKILHVITKGDVGGAQTHVVELALAQQRRGDEVLVAAGSDGPAMDRLRSESIDVTILGVLGHAVSPRADVAAVGAIRSLIAERRPTIVHAHSSKGGLLARIAARRERTASVYTAHGFPFQAGAPFSQRVQSLIGEWVGGHVGGAVICLTPDEEALARRWHIARRSAIHIVPNGLPDTAPVRPRGRTGPPVLVMVARFAPPKQQRALIEVLASIDDLAWEMIFVGDGPGLDACRSAATPLGERVRFVGHRDDVGELLAAADVGLLWSGYEGMPIALMEAMRAGLCCVASDLPGVRALFGDPPAGLTAADSDELAAHLRSVIVSRARVDDLGDRARQRYLTAFTIERMVDEVCSVYDSVVARG